MNKHNSMRLLSLVLALVMLLPMISIPTLAATDAPSEEVIEKTVDTSKVKAAVSVEEDGSVQTSYGTIPAENAGNVFALFMNGAFVGGKDEWKDIQKLIRTTLDSNKGATVTALMRQDHTHDAGNISSSDRIPFMNGTVVVDLGGYTLTSSRTLFELGTTGYEGNFDTSYEVKNGYINVRKGNLLASESRSNYDKHIALSFVGVEFNLDGCTKEKLFISYGDSTSYTGKNFFDITFDGCTFDLRGAAPVDSKSNATALKLFGFGDAVTSIRASVVIKGGEILSDDISNVKLFTKASAFDSYVFAADENGAYTTLTLPAGVEISTFGSLNDRGDGVSFANGQTSGDSTVYTLEKNDCVTKYGVISAKYVSISSYPVAVFKQDGSCYTACASFGAAMEKCRTFLSSSKGSIVYVVLRDDHSNTADSIYLGRVMGTIYVDLNGYTLTRGNGRSLIEAGTKNMTEEESSYVANFNVYNGRILALGTSSSNSGHVLTYQSYVNFDTTINLSFTNVTFGISSDVSTEKGLYSVVARSWGASGGATGIITSELRFTDCTFDFTGAEGTYAGLLATRVVSTSAAKTSSNVSVVFEGGKLVSAYKGVKSKITLTDVDSSDTVTFVANRNGEYFSYDLAEDVTPITSALSTDVGEMYFVRESFAKVDGVTHHYFELGQKLDDCDGAVVPYRYASNPEKYPYIIVQNGKFVAAREDWRGATAIAFAYVDNDTDEDSSVTLYLVRDVNESTGGTYLSGIRGTVTVDLNGYTLTATQTLLEAAGRHAYTARINVVDGTILAKRTGNGSIIAFNQDATKGDGSLVDGVTQEMHFTFTGVTFRYAEGATSSNAVAVTWAGASVGRLAGFLTFNNCTFDMRAATKSINLINANNAPQIDVITVINGGQLLLPASDLVTWFKAPGETDSFTFGTYEDAYTRLSYTSGEAPTDVYVDTNGNKCQFVSVGNGGYVLTLLPAYISGASVGLGSTLSVYYFLKEQDPAFLEGGKLCAVFTVNGVSVTVTDYWFENGEYIFELSGLAPQQLADTIDVTVYLGDDVLATHEGYSIKKNCLNLLEKGAEGLGISDFEYQRLEPLLVDLLRYGAAAQEYLDYKQDAPILEGVDLAGKGQTWGPDGTDAMHLENLNAAFYFASATVHFDTFNEIRIKVKLNGDAELAKFTVDGEGDALSDLVFLGNGTYLLVIEGIKAHDFARRFEIELFYDGAVTARLSYSVNSYAAAMIETTQNEEMRALAEALYSYGKNAAIYIGM